MAHLAFLRRCLQAKLADGFEHFYAAAFGVFNVLNAATGTPENFA
jgi:hypothetical protein